MDAKEFLWIVNQECKAHQSDCKGCKFSVVCSENGWMDVSAIAIAEEIIANRVTYLQKIKELLPNILICSDGTPKGCPYIYFGHKAGPCDKCIDCIACWNREYKEVPTCEK